MAFRLLEGHVLARLADIQSESVHCVVTSPPYYGLRDYGVGGQIGLEKTPAEFIAKLVAVFREVRRVLRSDGVMFLNMGDSYAGGNAIGRNDAGRDFTGGGGNKAGSGNPGKQGTTVRIHDLKPKDLMGMPWRLAEALRAPYYTGKITDERDRVWLAAMLDAEGCLFLHKRKAGQNNGQGYSRLSDSFGAGMEIANTSKAIIDRIHALIGKGSICLQGPDETGGRRKQMLYRWNLRSNECRQVVRELYPHLVAKQHQARLLLGCPSSGPDAERAHAGLIALHRGRASDIDFPAPASMFEPGWYLRQDIVWSKLNPMPESVTDRCTKAHEYLFLLTKSSRYFYDAEAIKERAVADHTAGNMTHKGLTAYEAGDERHRTKQGLVAYASRNDKNAFRGQGSNRHGENGPANRDGRDMVSVGLAPTRNKRSVWEIATEPFPEAHFATFPTKLVEPCILAGTSERGVCHKCGKPWVRVIEKVDTGRTQKMADGWDTGEGGHGTVHRDGREAGEADVPVMETMTIGWRPDCAGHASEAVPASVLDPFSGAGTTALVAQRLGREAIGIELNPEYAEMSQRRVETYWRTPQPKATGEVASYAPLFAGLEN